ncbi:Trafficking protein particle complex subunit 4 [Oryzias melastigma]|uniref:Trafficking protein particle complex subunit 4 n=1 Tax=Oryzias melastigma TaxID=30732 RepID=A0A834KZA1_ORYME|nr:Trafficking protein particle complex subunit 4 [Oryzias melastigma]
MTKRLSYRLDSGTELKWDMRSCPINGVDVMGKNTADGKDILEYLQRLRELSRFYTIRTGSSELQREADVGLHVPLLSPEVGSSGIEMLETDVFKLHCFQTLTGSRRPRLSGAVRVWRPRPEV